MTGVTITGYYVGFYSDCAMPSCEEFILDPEFWSKFKALPHAERLRDLIEQAYINQAFLENCDEINGCISEISLGEGAVYSREQFISHPLFKYSKNSHKVFSDLWILSFSPFFSVNYEVFLESLRSPQWFSRYNNACFAEKQAYFALFAYLRHAITREELLIIHAVGGAYAEVKEAFGPRVQPTIEVVGVDKLEEVLTIAHFPPFSVSSEENILVKRKGEREIEEVKRGVIEGWRERSFVLQTLIRYPLDPSLECSDGDTYTKIGLRVGFTEREVYVFPPEFTIGLTVQTSCYKLPPQEDQMYTLGYSHTAGDPFYRGFRVISIPSRLFPIQSRPHGAIKGPPALSLLVHDVNYHIPLEGNLPAKHKEIFMRLALIFNSRRSGHPLIRECKEPALKQLSQQLAQYLADREFFLYGTPDVPGACFWKTLKRKKRSPSVILVPLPSVQRPAGGLHCSNGCRFHNK